ncbi:transposase (plasmid) [Rhodococcus koreensis]|nr:transposase [Rhodococcus koreensis]
MSSGEPTTYRLLTTITDPEAAPAAELAGLYSQRWEIETAFDELKTPPARPGVVMRSKTPDGDPGDLQPPLRALPHRSLMHSAATDSGHDPGRLAFTRTLRAARRTTASHPSFPLEPRMMRTAVSPRISATNACLPDVPASTPCGQTQDVRLPHQAPHHRNAPRIGRRPVALSGDSVPSL